MFGTLSRTASIIGVDITNPGEGYAEGVPLIDFNDKCNQGRGAYGKAIVDRNMKSPTYGQVTSVVILSPGENFPTDGSEEQEAFIRDVIIEDPGIGYEDAEISDDIRPIVQDGRIAAIEIVEQIPYNRLPDLSVTSDTGYGSSVIRPILSTEREDRRTDPEKAGVFKVVQCVGAFSSETVQQQEVTSEVVRPIEETAAEPVQPTTTTQTNVSDTTTTSQTDTSTTTTTGTTDTPSQQTTGQSDPPSSGGGSGSMGSEGSGGGVMEDTNVK